MNRRKMTMQRLMHILFTKPQTKRQAVRRKRLWIAVGMRLAILVVLLVLLILLISGISSCARHSAQKKAQESSEKAASAKKKNNIQIGFTGAMILHEPILRSYKNEEGDYDFAPIFSYIKKYYSKPDIMTCEMEGTIGNENTGITGFPLFSYPDTFPGDIENSGIDLQMLATNHVYDKRGEGLKSTLDTYIADEINFTGIRQSKDDKTYKVMTSGNIKVGFADYTYGTQDSFNALQVEDEDVDKINMFKESDPGDEYYDQVKAEIKAMKKEGADFIVYQMHWGAEYELEPSSDQTDIAQKLCDLGVDAVIGGHPHCEQPIEVLTSEDGSHKTFCIYSVGNALSNQRKGNAMDTAHCEDGVIITIDLKKDKSGKVSITDVNMTPTWVARIKRGGSSVEDEAEEEEEQTVDTTGETAEGEEGEEDEEDVALYDFAILPLDNVEDIEKNTGLEGIAEEAKASYERTMKVLGEGINTAKTELLSK